MKRPSSERMSRNRVNYSMSTFQIDTTIRQHGELHLEHLPFSPGQKVHVVLYVENGEDEKNARKAEYEAFMRGYADEDSVYDSL